MFLNAKSEQREKQFFQVISCARIEATPYEARRIVATACHCRWSDAPWIRRSRDTWRERGAPPCAGGRPLGRGRRRGRSAPAPACRQTGQTASSPRSSSATVYEYMECVYSSVRAHWIYENTARVVCCSVCGRRAIEHRKTNSCNTRWGEGCLQKFKLTLLPTKKSLPPLFRFSKTF